MTLKITQVWTDLKARFENTYGRAVWPIVAIGTPDRHGWAAWNISERMVEPRETYTLTFKKEWLDLNSAITRKKPLLPGEKIVTWIDARAAVGSEERVLIDPGNEIVYRSWVPPLELTTVLGALAGGIIGLIVKPTRRLMPLIGAVIGAGSAFGTQKLYVTPLKSSCPVCGFKEVEEPMGIDYKCRSCGFVSSWTRK